MKTRLLIGLGGFALAGAVLAYSLRRDAATSPARAKQAAAGPSATPESHAGPRLQTERDAAAVFQRAFWRRPGPDVRILEGERREWTDQSSAVQKWQWFVALQTTPEFRQWLLEQNPFELARAETPVDVASTAAPPSWFPAAQGRSELTTYRARGGGLTVFLHPKSGRLFATDAGAGFAAAVR